ncbi:MAG: hypothetical protein RL518_2135 [Pseudomonadota bacterium]|jgi:hypothetical protein
MAKKITRLFVALSIATLSFVATEASAESYNPSVRALNKMSRRGDAAISMQSLAAVCPTVNTVRGSEFLWKSEISNHISDQDPRTSGPTFICNKVCPKKWPMNFYYSDGVKAGRVGYYGVYRVTGKPRAYCATRGAPKCSIRQIAANSKTAGRDGKLYLKVSDSACYQVNPLGRTGRP